MAVPAASCSITIPSSARARRRVSTTNAELAELSPECQPVPPGYSPSFGMFQETERMVQLSLNMLSFDKEDASLGETSKARASHETQIGALDKLASSWDFSSQRRQDFQHKFELLSRGAKRWKQKNNHRFFTPWDFSQIANAAVALSAGPASAERPGREGVSGSYFIRSRHDILGVFKPIDEESGRAETALACSPSERCLGTASGTENYFRSGGGAYREVAAYLLDHDHFARVPQTALARLDIALPASNGTENAGFQHEMIAAGAKNGAFQVYISNLGDADDFGPGVFLTESVHRIATLDIRVINCDRHGGNALVVRSERAGVSNAYELVPIDHGFVLPEFVPTCRWPVWMDWKQVKEPISARTKRYIETLDAEMDARILKDELEGCVSASSLAWLRVSTFLLKRGISLGLSLYEIGLFMFSRDPSRETSHLAKCAMEAYDAGVARERRLLSMQYDVSSTNSLTSSPSLKPKPAASLSSTVTSSRNAATSASGSSGGSQPATHFERSFSNDPIFAFDDYDIDAPVSAQHTAASAPSDGDDKQCAVGVNAPDTALNEDAELVEGGELSDAAWEYVVKYACRLLEQQLQDHERNRAAQSQRVNRESSPLDPETEASGLFGIKALEESVRFLTSRRFPARGPRSLRPKLALRAACPRSCIASRPIISCSSSNIGPRMVMNHAGRPSEVKVPKRMKQRQAVLLLYARLLRACVVGQQQQQLVGLG
eukprot:CAMPEP_0185848632 /NCGR_PEP_ID=MMETSP1354-20130828/3433_1 /TAXON_ID=708628 /ORGANISM="Erythrolobus madagascarensis, Strain CCMP3276" /LENGTH=720 /DNA_ID=CAMNT_0028549047 /DNA_START=559 /DNA_END=2722 /DNA_ORIENTATION=-